MKNIPSGTFMMGCTSEQSDCGSDEKPTHEVTISSFKMNKYEVTQEEWQIVMGNNPSNFSGCDKCPVEKVSWNEVQEFLKKLNKITGKINHYGILRNVSSKWSSETGNSELFWEAHLVGQRKEYCHMEQLTNLDALPYTGFKIAVFPLKIKGASAAPARVVAIFD